MQYAVIDGKCNKTILMVLHALALHLVYIINSCRTLSKKACKSYVISACFCPTVFLGTSDMRDGKIG